MPRHNFSSSAHAADVWKKKLKKIWTSWTHYHSASKGSENWRSGALISSYKRWRKGIHTSSDNTFIETWEQKHLQTGRKCKQDVIMNWQSEYHIMRSEAHPSVPSQVFSLINPLLIRGREQKNLLSPCHSCLCNSHRPLPLIKSESTFNNLMSRFLAQFQNPGLYHLD